MVSVGSRNGWPLAPVPDPSTWYSGESTCEGYTDYPNYAPSVAAGAKEEA